MVFLLGKTLPGQQHVLYALAAQFDGIGRHTASQLLARASIHKYCRVRELSERHLDRLRELLQPRLEAGRQERMQRAKLDKARPVPLPVPPINLTKK